MLKFFLIHCVCTLALAALLGKVCKVDKRFFLFFTLLFFISPPAVFFVWGPYRFYVLYALTGAAFFFLAAGAHRFYIFLRDQEPLVRVLFWTGILVFCGAVVSSSIAEINIRRSSLTFWMRESKRHPSDGAFVHLAASFESLKDFVHAQGFYQKALRINPKCMEAFEGLARVYQEMGSWDKSLDVYQKIIQMDPHVPEAYLGMGEDSQRLGNSTQAVRAYSRLLELYPDDEKLYVRVINAYGRAIAQAPQETIYKEKREEVLGEFEEFSKRRHYKAVDYFNLAFLYEQVGGKDEAIRFYIKALGLKPDHKQALFNLAKLYQDTGNLKTALETYTRLLHFYPRFVKAYLNMGEIINALGDVPKARRFYLKVIDLDPGTAEAYFNLGYLSESGGSLQEAISYYEKAIDADPKNAEVYYNLGNVYAHLNQEAEAIASYLKTVGLNPRHVDAFVNLSILSFKSRNFSGAIHYLEQARALGYNPPMEYIKTLEPYRGK